MFDLLTHSVFKQSSHPESVHCIYDDIRIFKRFLAANRYGDLVADIFALLLFLQLVDLGAEPRRFFGRFQTKRKSRDYFPQIVDLLSYFSVPKMVQSFAEEDLTWVEGGKCVY